MTTKTTDAKYLHIPCECQGEILILQKFDDEEEVYLTVYRYSFPNISFFRRMKAAIKVLRGEGIRTADVVLSKESFNKIKKFK